MSADFTPSLNTYTDLTPFRFWCQKILPLAYDDSLSYYELLCKVVDYLNKTMEDVELSIDDVEKLHDAYAELQGYVNDYFTNLDVQEEINNKLDALVADGTIHTIFSPDVMAILTQAQAATQQAINNIPTVVGNWLGQHVTQETGYVIDDSLSTKNAAADALATGVADSNIKSAIDLAFFGEIEDDDFVQGYRTQADYYTVHNQTTRCCSAKYYHVYPGDTISISNIAAGTKSAILGAGKTSATNYDSGWKTADFTYTAVNELIVFIEAAKSDDTADVLVSDITTVITLNDKSTRITDNENAIGELKSDLNNLPYAVYDSAYVTPNKYLDADGVEHAQTGWSLSQYLRINKTATYYIATPVYSSVVYSCFYDKDYGFISSFKTDTLGNNILTAPAAAKYVRFSIQTADINDFKYDSTLLVPYEDESVVPNLVYKADVTYTFREQIITGSYYDASGDITASQSWSRTPIYKVDEGDVVIIEKAQGVYAVLYDNNKSFIRALSNNNVGTRKYTVENGISYMAFNIVNTNLPTYNCTINGIVLGAKYYIPWLEASIQSIWHNKNYISHGDSITWQDGRAYGHGEHTGEIARGYQTIFSENVGLASYSNMGKSGWSMAVVNGNGIVDTIIGVADYTQYNLCTIACGTNDFKLNVPLGTLGVIGDVTFDDTTFYGAYRKAVEYILTNAPTMRIVLMTPLQRDNAGYDVNYTNSAGAKLIDYVNAVKAIGDMYGLPVCDMYGNSGFTKKTLSTYTMDGLHPNDVGYARMGGYLTGYLNAIGN